MLVHDRSRRLDCALRLQHPVHASAGQLDSQLAPARLEGRDRVARRGHQPRDHRRDASDLPDVARRRRCGRRFVGAERVPGALSRRTHLADAVPRERSAVLARCDARTCSSAGELLQLGGLHLASPTVRPIR